MASGATQPQKFPRSKYKRLSPREKAFVVQLSKGLNFTDAARAAGYSPKYAGQGGYQAYHIVKAKFPELLEKHGLTDDALIENYIKPGLEARETKFFQKDGIVTDEREVISWGARHSFLDTTLRLRGAIGQDGATDEGERNQTINLIVNIPRPERAASDRAESVASLPEQNERTS
jgi:hypothetical protein